MPKFKQRRKNPMNIKIQKRKEKKKESNSLVDEEIKTVDRLSDNQEDEERKSKIKRLREE